jgi:branched-chain amino acid transport system ATP-binding protein
MMLSVRGLNSFYGMAHILTDVSLEAARGEAVALLGRNGAGKTTSLRSIMGLAGRTEGEIVFNGRSILGLPPHAIARRGLAFVPEDRRIFSRLTVLENLLAARQPAWPGLPAWELERVLALFPHLAGMGRRWGGQLSGGEQQMLAIARGLMGNPGLLMLDEPSEGLAPTVAAELARAILEVKAAGLTVLLCEQNLPFAEAISDRVYVLSKGQIAYEGGMGAFMRNAKTRRAHLAV